jgi:hypothetical protein
MRSLSLAVALLLVTASAHAASFQVTTDADFGAGSLRAAIEAINAEPQCGTEAPCFLAFTASEAAPLIIKPATPLPAIRKCNVRIGGPGDPERSRTDKQVVISGEHATYGNGLEIRASCAANVPGVTIENIAVSSWPWNGIYFEAPAPHADDLSGHYMNRVYVGTDRTGHLARPNGSRGIITDSPHEVIWLYNSVASGNVRSGVAFFQGKRATVIGSNLGVGIDNEPLGNGGAGLFTIDVPLLAALNTIGYNGMGVAIAKGTREAAITENVIHSNQGLAIDWGLDARTPADGETIQAPRILSAFYDASANITYIRAVVYLKAGALGNRFNIEPYRSNERGDAVAHVPEFPRVLFGSVAGGEETFEIGIPGDFRGQYLALQTHIADDRNQRRLSSEISEPIAVP